MGKWGEKERKMVNANVSPEKLINAPSKHHALCITLYVCVCLSKRAFSYVTRKMLLGYILVDKFEKHYLEKKLFVLS